MDFSDLIGRTIVDVEYTRVVDEGIDRPVLILTLDDGECAKLFGSLEQGAGAVFLEAA